MRAKKNNKQLPVKSSTRKVKTQKTETQITSDDARLIIKGSVRGQRVPSRILEEQIQEAVQNGARELHIVANGQHGIGGRIWPREGAVRITVEGPTGQRVGSMGMPGTEIIVKNSA